MKEFGADKQALDATRILRVPGSINSKTHTEVKIIDIYDYLYELREIQNDTLELNNMFIQPLRENEVIRATKSAETVFKDKNKDYKYKNDTLINLLEISERTKK